MGLEKISTILKVLHERAPLSFAESWDNVGLLLGDAEVETQGVVISNDLTFEAIEFAQKKDYRLILNHHPCIFPKQRGLGQVRSGTPVFEALKRGIQVAAFHTNFDRCALEVVHSVSQGLGLSLKGRLHEDPSVPLREVKWGSGYGFWGEFLTAKSFAEFAKDVKELFNIKGFLITSPPPVWISKVGFVAGKGSAFVEASVALGCDVFITGETGYHSALVGARQGTSVLEMGHRQSEKFFGRVVKDWLASFNLEVSEVSTSTQELFVGD